MKNNKRKLNAPQSAYSHCVIGTASGRTTTAQKDLYNETFVDNGGQQQVAYATRHEGKSKKAGAVLMASDFYVCYFIIILNHDHSQIKNYLTYFINKT